MIPIEELRREYRISLRNYRVASELNLELDKYSRRLQEASEKYTEALKLERIVGDKE